MVSNFDEGHLVWSILTHKCEKGYSKWDGGNWNCVVCMAIKKNRIKELKNKLKNKLHALSFRDGTGLPLS